MPPIRLQLPPLFLVEAQRDITTGSSHGGRRELHGVIGWKGTRVAAQQVEVVVERKASFTAQPLPQ